MNSPQQDREKKKVKVIAILEVSQAIDFTPIYYITVTANLKKGQILRFDGADIKDGISFITK